MPRLVAQPLAALSVTQKLNVQKARALIDFTGPSPLSLLVIAGWMLDEVTHIIEQIVHLDFEM